MATIGSQIRGKLIGRRVPSLPDTGVSGSSGSLELPGGDTGTVASSNDLQEMVQKTLAGNLAEDPGIRFGDGSFYLPTIEEIQLILQSSELDRREWLAERFDCDDFAYVLKGEMSTHAYQSDSLRYALCVGLVWGSFDWIDEYHAVNWFIESGGNLAFIEPQTDVIYEASHCKGQITLLLV